MRRQKSPRSWAEAYRELSAIDELAQAILARSSARIEEAVSQAGCCITIAEILREFRTRAWRRAVCAYEHGRRVPPSAQLLLFG